MTNAIDRQSASWLVVKEYLEGRLLALQKELKNPELGWSMTQAKRGQIREVEYLLALPDKQKRRAEQNMDRPGKGEYV